MDFKSLSLPNQQDVLMEQVAAANPRTIVVLETDTAVTMPWINDVAGVLEAWFAGSKGADAVANILLGDVNPSAKLPITFPLNEADLPRPSLVMRPPRAAASDPGVHTVSTEPVFSVSYDEGLKVGYKWYDAEKKPVLFPFGYGLSYTTYQYSDLKVTPGKETDATFQVKNIGSRAGDEIAEVYASLPPSAGEPPTRLVGWSKVHLNPGESKELTVSIPRRNLSIYDESDDGWKLLPDKYTVLVGGSSRDLPLSQGISF